MPIWLTGYGPSNLEVLLFLIGAGVLLCVGSWLLWRRQQNMARRLRIALSEAQRQHDQLHDELEAARHENELAEARHHGEMDEERAHADPAQIKALHDHLQRVIAHEVTKGLHFILTESGETLVGLHDDQDDLRVRLKQVRAKAHEMMQHARNIVEMPDLERNAAQREMVNLRKILGEVLKELFPYAEDRNVHLRTQYGSLGPISVNKPLATQMYRNIVHNAIKYSFHEGVVDVVLRLENEEAPCAIVEVRDRGRGIATKDQERIFEQDVRGDGLVEPGSGLGLAHARRIARLHGGDVALVESNVKEGSMFRISLPYTEQGDLPPAVATEGKSS